MEPYCMTFALSQITMKESASVSKPIILGVKAQNTCVPYYDPLSFITAYQKFCFHPWTE